MYIFVIFAASVHLASSYCSFYEKNARVIHLPEPMDGVEARGACDMKLGSLSSDQEILRLVTAPWQYGCTHVQGQAFDPLEPGSGPIEYLEGEEGKPTPMNPMGFSINRRKCRGQLGGAFCTVCHKTVTKEVHYISGPFESPNRTGMEYPKDLLISSQCRTQPRGNIATKYEVEEMFDKPWTKGCSYVAFPQYSWTWVHPVQFLKNGSTKACDENDTADAAFCRVQPDLNDASKHEVINIAIDSNALHFGYEHEDAWRACRKKLASDSGRRFVRLAYGEEILEKFAEPWKKGCAFTQSGVQEHAPVKFSENGTSTTCYFKPVKAGAFCVVIEKE